MPDTAPPARAGESSFALNSTHSFGARRGDVRLMRPPKNPSSSDVMVAEVSPKVIASCAEGTGSLSARR